jgi:hypothetical protein
MLAGDAERSAAFVFMDVGEGDFMKRVLLSPMLFGYAIIIDGAYDRDDRLEVVVKSVINLKRYAG